MADFDFRAAQRVAQSLAKALDDSNLKQLPELVESLSALSNRAAELKISVEAMEKRAATAKEKEVVATTAAVEVKRNADNEARRIFASCEESCAKAKLQSQRELSVLEEQKRAAVDAVKADVIAQRDILTSLQRATQAAAESKAALEGDIGTIKSKMAEFIQ